MRLQMHAESEDTESESEVTQEKEEYSSFSSVDGSSSEEEPQKKQSGSSSSSSDSSEDSDEEKPRREKTDVVNDEAESGSGSSSSSGDSSEEEASENSSSESEEERPRKMQEKKPHKSGSFKRLKKVSVPNSSSDDDSDLEVEGFRTGKDSTESVKEEADADDEESEDGMGDGHEHGSETDSEDEWQSRLKYEDEENSRDRKRMKDEIVAESDKGSDLELNEDEWQDEDEPIEEKNEEEISGGDVMHARHVMRNITARVSLVEEVAIRRGVKLSGPPIEFATTHLDEYARKFRWPQHMRNLRKIDFSQDPSEVLEDHDVFSELKESDSNEQERPQESAFAQVPRPIVALAAETFRRALRKRKRATAGESQKERRQDPPSATALLNMARIGGQFGDHFVESLLSANGKALQGIDNGFDYDKRCWSSLPTKKKPVANWRFVLEHVRRTMGSSECASYPPMKQATLDRITSRLKTLYGHTTQHEEYDIFQAAGPTSSSDASETSEEQSGISDEEPFRG